MEEVMTHNLEENELNHPNSETITDSNLNLEPDDSSLAQTQNDSNEEEEKESVIFQNYRGLFILASPFPTGGFSIVFSHFQMDMSVF